MTRNGELAHELEEEAFFETEEEDFLEGEEEGEGFIGALGNVLGGLLGETEEESHEHEAEEEAYFETEDLLEGEEEYEAEEELFLEGEEEAYHELEDEGEAFFGGIAKLIKRAAPILKQIAKVAAPVVGSMVAGPLGGRLAAQATQLLGEGEYEEEGFLEGEAEWEAEGEYELHEYEATLSHAATEAEAAAELMASIAAGASTEAEAEAMIGAATIGTLSARERRELQRVLAHLVRGSAILTRMLRRRRITRPAVRAVPLIVHQTAKTLTRQAAAGRPVTRQQAGRVMARHTHRVLSSPRICTRAIQRNALVARRVPVPRQAIVAAARPASPRLVAMRPAAVRRVAARPAYARPPQRVARPAYARPATPARRRY